MDFSSFNLQDTGDLFKQTYNEQQIQQNQQDFYTFIDNHNHSNNNNNNYDHTFNVPQLSPGNDNSFTNSSVLSGHNPDYQMSPLLIASKQQQQQQQQQQAFHTPLQHAMTNSNLDDYDDEEFFTPLVSPAIQPAYNNMMGMNSNNNHFSPLSSPALPPTQSPHFSGSGDTSTLQQKLAFIERQQQQLRSMHNQLRQSTSSPILASSNSDNFSSPQLNSTTRQSFAAPKQKESPKPNGGFISPVTPSLLMKLGGKSAHSSPNMNPNYNSNVVDHMPVLPVAMLPVEETKVKKRKRSSVASTSSPAFIPSSPSTRLQQSPRTLKPLISPSLQPNGKRLSTIEEETARALLTSKSNYENLKEGKAKSLGIDFDTTIQSGIENRRTAHKAAEQKRRDVLKQSFDSLRTEIIDFIMQNQDDEEDRATKEKDVKQMSKVVLLQHSYEYIIRLKQENKTKTERELKMKQELMFLREKLGLPQVTAEEQQQEEDELLQEKLNRQERMKRLKNIIE